MSYWEQPVAPYMFRHLPRDATCALGGLQKGTKSCTGQLANDHLHTVICSAHEVKLVGTQPCAA